jgi:DNA-binding NarL/FixJ family response regulator
MIMSLPIRILIADNDVNFSESLGRLLDEQQGMTVVEIVRDGQGAVNCCRETWPDVVLMDLHLPVLDSVRAIESILTQNERIKILGLATDPDDRYAVEAIKVGASGCLEKHKGIQNGTIVTAIRQVVEGDVLLNPALASSILQEFHRLSE